VPQWVSDEWTKQNVEPAHNQPLAGANSAPTAEGSQSAEPAPGSEGVVAGLEDLAQLHATGALSDAEFADAKSRLLAHG
jgi:hypothetical protein